MIVPCGVRCAFTLPEHEADMQCCSIQGGVRRMLHTNQVVTAQKAAPHEQPLAAPGEWKELSPAANDHGRQCTQKSGLSPFSGLPRFLGNVPDVFGPGERRDVSPPVAFDLL
jgi:hypothetical protein